MELKPVTGHSTFTGYVCLLIVLNGIETAKRYFNKSRSWPFNRTKWN